jgi:patatin-like phospholipase/acyl hydrolase
VNKPKRILSLDGGGVRGLIPATILVSFEKKLQKYSGNSDARIADYFDLIAGNSTGGVLTGIYLCPGVDDKTRPRYSAQDAVDLYMQHGDKIFDKSLGRRLKTGFGLFTELYNGDYWRGLIKSYVGDLTIKELLRPCLILSYDIQRKRAVFFTSAKAHRPEKNFLGADVLRATSALPIAFEPAQVTSESGEAYTLIDGLVFANNPSLCAVVEILKMHPDIGVRDTLVLSLGTGVDTRSLEFQQVKYWGVLQWLIPFGTTIYNATAQTVDHQLKVLFRDAGCLENYLRVNPDLETAPVKVNQAMDDASKSNMKDLVELGQRVAEQYDEELDHMAKTVVEIGTGPAAHAGAAAGAA